MKLILKFVMVFLLIRPCVGFAQTHSGGGGGGSGAATALTLGSTTQTLGATPATAAGQCLVSAGSGPYTWLAGACSGSASTGWSNLSNAGANLTLANAGYASTFNQISAVNWTWANTTAATSGTNQSSPVLNLNGKVWHAGASTTDSWTFQNVVTNGTDGASTLKLLHTGSGGTASVSIPAILNVSSPDGLTALSITEQTADGYYASIITNDSSSAGDDLDVVQINASPFATNYLELGFACNGSLNDVCTAESQLDDGSGNSSFRTITSTVSTGTAPFTVTSTTPVANLSIGGNAATATNPASPPWSIANGGTNAITAAAARIQLFPSASEVGDMVYCATWSGSACTSWALLSGNTSGTKWLQETSAGAPSWTTPSAGAGGSSTQVQYSNSGTLGGITDVTSDGTNMTVASGGTLTIASGATLTCAGGSTCPSGSGTVTVSGSPGANDFPYWTSGTNLTKVTAPTTPTGASFVPIYRQGTGWSMPALGQSVGRNVSTSSDSGGIVATDAANPITYTYAGSVTETLPTTTTLGVPNPGFELINGTTGTSSTVTVTAASSWPFYPNGNSSLSTATLVIPQSDYCFVWLDPAGSAWDDECHESVLTAGSNITFTRSGGGLSIAGNAGTVTVSGSPGDYDIPYWTTGTNVTKVSAPATNGDYYFGYHITGSAASAPADESLVASSTNSVGLTATPTYSAGTMRIEVTGGSYTGNAGTASNLSGTPALPSGTSASTQTASDTSTDLATDAFVHNVAYPVANTTATVATSTTINANTCTGQTNVTMTGLTTGMTIDFTATTDTSGVTGWGSPSAGLLYITDYPASNTLHWSVCNGTGSNITTSGSVTFNLSAR